MSHAHRSRPDPVADLGADERGELAAKVVLMELANASGPLAVTDLEERTLLSRAAVESALADLEAAGFCTELPGDERRPPRYAIQEWEPSDPGRRASSR